VPSKFKISPIAIRRMIHTSDDCAAIMESADSWGMRNRKTGKNKVQLLG